jgi:hypothetical protein
LSEVLLGALAVIAELPASDQTYRPNLGNADLVAAYVRSKYRSKPRVSGSLFLDYGFGLIAEDAFKPEEEKAAAGQRD